MRIKRTESWGLTELFGDREEGIDKESEKECQRSKEYQQGIVSQMLRENAERNCPTIQRKKEGRKGGRKDD